MKKLIALCALLITAPAMAHDWPTYMVPAGSQVWGPEIDGRCNSNSSCNTQNMIDHMREKAEAVYCEQTPIQVCGIGVGKYVEVHRGYYQPGMWGGHGNYIGEYHAVFQVVIGPDGLNQVMLLQGEHLVGSYACSIEGHDFPGSIPWYGPGGGSDDGP